MLRKSLLALGALLAIAAGAQANLLLTGVGSSGGAGGGGGLPLDSLSSTPTAAFSTRKLRTAYAGPALRVRATSTTETDIGFSGNDLDVTTMLGVCPVDCWVVTWYDQTTNARDFTQSTTAKQPQIVSGHALLNPINSRATINYTNAGLSFLQNAGVTLGTVISGSAYTIISSSRPTAGGASGTDYLNGAIFSNPFGDYLIHGGSSASVSGLQFDHSDPASHIISKSITFPSTHVIFHGFGTGTSSITSAGTMSVAIDGGTITGSLTSLGNVNVLTDTLTFGSNYNLTASFDGSINEFIIWNVAASKADVNTVAASRATYDGITWTTIP